MFAYIMHGAFSVAKNSTINVAMISELILAM